MQSEVNQKENLNRIITVPNLLSFFRLCLIPVIIWSYCVKKNPRMQGSDRKVPHRTECIFMARTVVYEIVCRTIIAERRGVRYVYSSNLQNKRFLYGQNA